MRKVSRGSNDPAITPDLIAFDQQQFVQKFERAASTDDNQPAAPQVMGVAPLADSSSADARAAGGDVSIQAVTGSFNSAFGVVTVLGDGASNAIEFSRNAAGTILVNGGAIPVQGGTPTVANTTLIQAFGLGGNDVITLNEANGALPRANLFGGNGNDTLTGGSGGDLLFGQTDNDTLLGKGGTDFLFGGNGNDVLTGGDGDDQMFGESGNDRMIWNPGDDSDLMEGGSGSDTAEVNGANGAETFAITANGARVRFDRVDPAPFALDIGTTENLVLNANGGDDVISASGNLAALIKLTIDGGAGNDTINGGNGNDVLLGGDGDDFIDGNQGDDLALLGAGDDIFQWDPGDGSDVVEGQAGFDTMLFNGSGANEIFDASANGERLRFTRNVGNIVMDTNDVERVDLNALGGADTIQINDLTGTDVEQVQVDLGANPGQTGDGQADRVNVNGSAADEVIVISNATGEIVVAGLAAETRIRGTDADGRDQLQVNGAAGDDVIDASGLTAGAVELTLLGGLGVDVFIGSQGDDLIIGQDGDDVALMGAGDDTFVWNPGDDNDTLEGQSGFDTMLFNGNNANENIDISANGERARFFRNVASVTMDSDDVERIEFNAQGGADNIVVNDLSGTDVTEIAINLAAAGGGGDAQVDTVRAVGTNGDDVAIVVGEGSNLQIIGLAAQIIVTGAETGDQAIITGLAGDDVIDASGVSAGAMSLVLDGGDGDDVLIGGAGNDVIFGGAGDDVLIGGEGDDVLDGGDGDDIIIGGPGNDVEINGFLAGAGSEDRVDVSHLGVDFEWLMAHASDVDGNVVLDLGDQQLTLRGVSTSALHQDDFLI